jgi:hypothetical protein
MTFKLVMVCLILSNRRITEDITIVPTEERIDLSIIDSSEYVLLQKTSIV